MTEEMIGKIKSAEFGFGGYQGAEIGLCLEFGGPAWGTAVFEGHWSEAPTDRCQWTAEDQTQKFGYVTRRVRDLLTAAKVSHISELTGKPVRCTFEGGALKSWWILVEAT